jgi:hypothetical protein
MRGSALKVVGSVACGNGRARITLGAEAATTHVASSVAAIRSSMGVLFALFAAVGCVIPSGAAKGDAEAPVCCRTDPDAGPETCVCEAAKKDIVMVTGTTCSLSTTVNGQAVAFTGIVVPACP